MPLEAIDRAVKIVREGHLRRAAEPETERPFIGVSMRRIMGPRHDVEILAHQRRIHRGEQVHEVARDPLAIPAIPPQSPGLKPQIIRRLVRKPPLRIEQRVLVHLRDQFRLVRDADLIEILIHLRPKRRAPIAIQVVDGAVFVLQPRAKFALANVAVTRLLAVMAEFIVELPAPHARVVAVTATEFVHDFPHVLAVGIDTPARLLARAVQHPPARGIDHQNLRMLFAEPHRRRGTRRAEHHLQALVGAQLDIAVKPGKIEMALLRFHESPREFAHVDKFQVQFLDVADVARPLVRRPRLGIIINPDAHQVRLRKKRRIRRPRRDEGQSESRYEVGCRKFHGIFQPVIVPLIADTSTSHNPSEALVPRPLRPPRAPEIFDVQRWSMFDVPCSMFDVRCSMFDVPYPRHPLNSRGPIRTRLLDADALCPINLAW